jgi:hypothetical protein
LAHRKNNLGTCDEIWLIAKNALPLMVSTCHPSEIVNIFARGFAQGHDILPFQG